MIHRSIALAAAACLLAVPGAARRDHGICATITEIRIDQPGADLDEYFELSGFPGMSLTGLYYVVVGDGPAGSGEIEHVTDLTGLFMPEDGRFLCAEPTYSLGGQVDFITPLNFENGDNVTHYVVTNFTGAVGQDIDLNDDGIPEMTPWAGNCDRIALIVEPNPPATTEFHYGPPTVGPDGGSVPGHVIRCPDDFGTFEIGAFETGVNDTPGVANSTLLADVDRLSLMAGGTQTMTLCPGFAFVGQSYLVLGSISGTSPGVLIQGVTVPLQFDAYTQFTFSNPNAPPLQGGFGSIGFLGKNHPTLKVPAGTDPALAGLAVYHAYGVFDDDLNLTHVSNALTTVLDP